MRAIKFTADKLEFIMKTYIGLIKDIEDDEKREGILKLMGHMGERLFEAPASSNLNYHNCCVGGLAEHSLRVYKNLTTIAKHFGEELHRDSMIVCALMHDLGKVGSKDEPYYIPKDSEWHNDRGIMYDHNEKLGFLGGAQRSLRVLAQFDVPLTEDEYKAILIHDGQYIPENRPYAHKEGRLGLLLHQADMLACSTELAKWEAIQ